jgi:hypothetical protein
MSGNSQNAEPTKHIGAAEAVGILSVFVVYLGLLMALSICLGSLLVQVAGVAPTSNVGLVGTAVISGTYILFEFSFLINSRDAPLLILVFTTATLPFTIAKGLDSLPSEYNRFREFLRSFPHLLSRLIPFGMH